MPALHTDPRGVLRFAAISRTAIGSRTARLKDLRWFYECLPRRGVAAVLHLGSVVDDIHALPSPLAGLYPHVEGVTTFEVQNGFIASVAPLMAARRDWLPSPGRFDVVHGGSGAQAGLRLVYDRHSRVSLSRRAKEALAAEIILVGGCRKVEHRYFRDGRGFIGTVGVFDSRPNYKNPPAIYGGTIVEVTLNDDGSLASCVLTFRDLSGGMPDP